MGYLEMGNKFNSQGDYFYFLRQQFRQAQKTEQLLSSTLLLPLLSKKRT